MSMPFGGQKRQISQPNWNSRRIDYYKSRQKDIRVSFHPELKTENMHGELPAIEDEPEPETVQPPAGREEALHRYPLRIRRIPDRYGICVQH